MGKGDIKTTKGKIVAGSYGKSRPKKKQAQQGQKKMELGGTEKKQAS